MFKDTMLTAMTDPKSDQIGLKTTEGGKGAAWIAAQLETPLMSPSGEYEAGQDFKNLVVCGFGTTVWRLMNQPDATKRAQNEAVLRDVMKPLGEGVACQFGVRFDEFKDVMSRPLFDDPISRMRSERQPLDAQGKPIPVGYESAQLHGLGFDNVAVTAADSDRQAELDQPMGAKVNAAGAKVYANINGAARDGAPIELGSSSLPESPFMMASDEIQLAALNSPLMHAYQNLLFSTQGGADQTFHEALGTHAFTQRCWRQKLAAHQHVRRRIQPAQHAVRRRAVGRHLQRAVGAQYVERRAALRALRHRRARDARHRRVHELRRLSHIRGNGSGRHGDGERRR
ncbi:hypothetical protein [Burkholderia pyrrocinia]